VIPTMAVQVYYIVGSPVTGSLPDTGLNVGPLAVSVLARCGEGY
jgi:hypothetical protein